MMEKSPNAIFRGMKNGGCKWEGTKVNKTAGTEWMSEREKGREMGRGKAEKKSLRQRRQVQVTSRLKYSVNRMILCLTATDAEPGHALHNLLQMYKTLTLKSANLDYACTYYLVALYTIQDQDMLPEIHKINCFASVFESLHSSLLHQ